MGVKNQTTVTEFILLGLTDDPQLKILLFILFLIVYIITMVGNIGISALVVSESRLHTPMYIFLSNLSLSDYCYSSVIVPNLLRTLISEKKTISFTACAAQNFCFVLFIGLEGFLLSAMAYDRYIAICHPLVYHLIMNRSMCVELLIGTYVAGVLDAVSHTTCTFNASFCGPNVIDHFFCDIPPLLKLSCSDPFIREIVIFAVAFIFGLATLLIAASSYVYIISTILKIPSTSGKLKSFSTCGSHLTAVSLFYGTALFMYLRLPGGESVTQTKVVSVCYTIVIPMLNPFIYSLRNQDVKAAFWKRMRK